MQHAHVIIPTPHPQERYVPMSYAEYRAMEHPTGSLVEWVDGVAIFHMPPTIAHQDIAGLIYAVLRLFVFFRKLGFVGIAPMEMYHTPGQKSREPDVLFVLAEHAHRIMENKIVGPADVVVEVVSPSSATRDRHTKREEYEHAGVQEYWVIDALPNRREILLYVASDIRKFYQKLPDSQGRYHSEIVPGFWLNPTWFWQTPLPGIEELVRMIDPAILQDPETLRLAKMEGWELGRNEGIAIGRNEGITEGFAMGQITIARSMLAKEIAPSIIAECTGLSLEEVSTLANNNG